MGVIRKDETTVIVDQRRLENALTYPAEGLEAHHV